MNQIHIHTPFDEQNNALLHAGDIVLVNGIIYGARDAAHKRMAEMLSRGEMLPFPLNDQAIYYVGPAPAKPGAAIGPAGPTTSGRMDSYTIPLLEKGISCLIGKGSRSVDVKAALVQYRAVYLAAVGGAAALLSQRILASQIIAFEDLGTEAIYKLVVEDFPAIVINDIYGEDAYHNGRQNFLIENNQHGN